MVIPTDSCVTPGAVYKVHYTEDPGGTCGPIDDSVSDIIPDGGVSISAGCVSGPAARYQGCSVFIDEVCTQVVQGVTVTSQVEGRNVFSSDGSTASGTLAIHISESLAGGTDCTSTYAVNETRL